MKIFLSILLANALSSPLMAPLAPDSVGSKPSNLTYEHVTPGTSLSQMVVTKSSVPKHSHGKDPIKGIQEEKAKDPVGLKRRLTNLNPVQL